MFDYPTILAAWDTFPTVRLLYAPSETGWAKPLDDVHYCVANVPLAAGLSLYDIVTITRHDGRPAVDAIVQSYFSQKWGVRYPVGSTKDATHATFRRVAEACHDAGGHLEGMLPGLALLNAPATMDVPATLGALGIAGMTWEACTSDEEAP